MLSFGEEAEDVAVSKSGKSTHDLAASAGGNLSEGKNSEEKAERQRQKLSSVRDRLMKRKAEKEMMDIRTKLKKTDVVAEFWKEEKQSIVEKSEVLAKELKPKNTMPSYYKKQKTVKKTASKEDATLAMLGRFKQKFTKIYDHEDGTEEEKKGDGGEAECEENVAGESLMKNTEIVKCKGKKGIFDLKKFHSGHIGHCIKLNQNWVTPNEFEKAAGSKSKNYKRSLKINGETLRKFLERKNIENPTRKRICESEKCDHF